MPEPITDPRVSTYGGSGYEVTTKDGVYRVLDSGVLGWGVYTGQNLDLVFSPDGPVIGAAGPDELVAGLLKADDDTLADDVLQTAGLAEVSAVQDDVSDDTDGM